MSDTNLSTIRQWMETEQVQAQITRALAKSVDPELFAAQCIIAASDPALSLATPGMIFAALRECASMGLLPGKQHKQVALIYRRAWGDNPPMIQVSPQWQGMKLIMLRDPSVKYLDTFLVHERDEFSIEQAPNGDVVRHKYDPFDPARTFVHPQEVKKGETSGLRGGYLKAMMTDGVLRYHFVSADKIERNRQCSEVPYKTKSGKPGVWLLWYAEQCLKTVLRDAHARGFIAFDPAIDRCLILASERDNEALGNDPTRRADVAEPAKLEAPRGAADRVMAILTAVEAPPPNPQPQPKKAAATPRTRVEPREEPEAPVPTPKAPEAAHSAASANGGENGGEDAPFTDDDLNLDFDLEPSRRAGRER